MFLCRSYMIDLRLFTQYYRKPKNSLIKNEENEGVRVFERIKFVNYTYFYKRVLYRKREKVRIDFRTVDPECNNSRNRKSYTST